MLDASSPQPARDDQPALFEREPVPSTDTDLAPAEPQPALPLRADTMLGVCEALGQDFGFNPNYLRIVLSSLVMWSLAAAIAIYLGLGVIVALSRWVAPSPRPATAPQIAAGSGAHAVAANANTEALSAAA